MNKKNYTSKETADFKAARQKPVKRTGTVIWDSGSKGTFRGSVRSQFTGPRRNNFI